MSGEQLRHELERIADRAPAVEVDAALFDRGRRATRRARVLTAAAVVGCLAVLTAVAVPLLRPDPPPFADSDVIGVPNHLYAVPDHVADEPETGLRIGRGAAAFVTENGVPVVVDAQDGAYHVLRLRGLLDDSPGGGYRFHSAPPLALSPDGTRIAWGILIDGTGGDPYSGIRVADLTTGEVLEIVPTAKDRNVLVGQLHWSADGRWLVWGGARIIEWTGGGSYSTSGQFGGVVAADGRTSPSYELPEAEVVTDDTVVSGNMVPDVLVSDEGEFAAVGGNGLWRDGRNTRFDLPGDAAIYGAWFRGDQVVGLRRAIDGAEGRAYLVDLPGPENTMVRTDLSDPRRIGQLDADTQVLAAEAVDEDGSPDPQVTLVRTGRPGGTETPVMALDRGVLDLTLATDLMSPDHPTVERPAPDWPWSPQRRVAVVAVPVLALLALTGATWLLRRRFSR